MSSNAARKTAIDSFYMLQRRKSVLPITNCLGSGGKLNSRKVKKKWNEVPISAPTKRSLCLRRSNIPRATVSSNLVPISRSPLLLRKDLLRLRGPNKGVREHYDVAIEENYEIFNNDNTPFATNVASPTKNQSSRNINNAVDQSNLVVVLDMDECIIHSQFLTIESDKENNYRQYEADRPQSHAFNHDDEPESIIPSSCESFRLCLSDGDQVHVNKRPNLDSFLKKITKRYQTYVFTAALEVYAGPLLDKLDPDGTMFAGRFYREHCTYEPTLGVYIKDLNNIKLKETQQQENNGSNLKTLFDDKRVVLIDNNPYSFLANPTNGILVSNFYDDPKDDTLQAVMELLEELDLVDDVRPILDEKFGLSDALQEVTKSHGYWK